MEKSTEKGFLKEILRSPNTVFSFKDLLLLWNVDRLTAGTRVNYYTRHGDLYHPRRALYAKDKNYNKFELATKILTPSYVSFETVLGAAGITFQHYPQIFLASYRTREIEVDGQKYRFKKIKSEILTNKAGIETKDNYSIASPERAFLDLVYLNRRYLFDNLSVLNWDKVLEILPIYQNKALEKRIKKYHDA